MKSDTERESNEFKEAMKKYLLDSFVVQENLRSPVIDDELLKAIGDQRTERLRRAILEKDIEEQYNILTEARKEAEKAALLIAETIVKMIVK